MKIRRDIVHCVNVGLWILLAELVAGETLYGAGNSSRDAERVMFSGENPASQFLVEQLGQAVQQLLHPLCRHSATTAADDGRWWTFTTRYVFGKREHTLVWRLSLKDGLVDDFDAVSDTSPVPTAKLAVKAKEKIAPLVKAYLEKR